MYGFHERHKRTSEDNAHLKPHLCQYLRERGRVTDMGPAQGRGPRGRSIG